MLGTGGPVITYSSTFCPAPPPWKHPSLASEPVTKNYFFLLISVVYSFLFSCFAFFPPPEAGFGQRGYGNAIYSEGCSLCSLSWKICFILCSFSEKHISVFIAFPEKKNSHCVACPVIDFSVFVACQEKDLPVCLACPQEYFSSNWSYFAVSRRTAASSICPLWIRIKASSTVA